MAHPSFYKLCFYVPEPEVESVKQAIFATGAGSQGNYRDCCWQTLGQGQFRPIEGANPAVGDVGQLCQLPEYKVEILCEANIIEAALMALKASHPYEEPAFDVIALGDFHHLCE